MSSGWASDHRLSATRIRNSLESEMDQDTAFAIGEEELGRGLRLICIGSPLSDVVLDA